MRDIITETMNNTSRNTTVYKPH